jgi:hypothetical protein
MGVCMSVLSLFVYNHVVERITNQLQFFPQRRHYFAGVSFTVDYPADKRRVHIQLRRHAEVDAANPLRDRKQPIIFV